MKSLLLGSLVPLFVACQTKNTNSNNASAIDTIKRVAPQKAQPTVPFHLKIFEGSNWNIQIDTIEESEFHDPKFRERFPKINGDSLLDAFARKYNGAIELKDSCCILSGFDGNIKMCRQKPSDERGRTGYQAVGYENGYLIMSQIAYESDVYTCFNPITRKYFTSEGTPIFIGKNIIYAAGGCACSDGIFEIVDMERHKHFSFIIYGWDLWRSYLQGNSIYLMFFKSDKRKYLRLTVSDV